MYLIDFEQSKNIYEILGVPRNVTLEELRKAFKAYTRPLEKASRRDGDAEADRKLAEINGLKDKVWNPEPRAEYDATLGDQPSFELGDPAPAHFEGRPALLRVFRRLTQDGEPPKYAAGVLAPLQAPSRPPPPPVKPPPGFARSP